MNSTNSNDNNDVTFDIPAREGTTGYVGLFFSVYLQTSALLTNPNVVNDAYRLGNITQFMISLVAGKEKRKMIREILKRNIESEISDKKKEHGEDYELAHDEREGVYIKCYLEIIGDITDFVDEHVGISKENKLGSV